MEKIFDIEKTLAKINAAILPTLKSLDTMHFEACVIAALEAGELTEIQAAKILGVDVVHMRAIKINVISRVIENYDLRRP